MFTLFGALGDVIRGTDSVKLMSDRASCSYYFAEKDVWLPTGLPVEHSKNKILRISKTRLELKCSRKPATKMRLSKCQTSQKESKQLS